MASFPQGPVTPYFVSHQPVYLTCKTCQVSWYGYPGSECWMCNNPTEPVKASFGTAIRGRRTQGGTGS